MKDDIYSFVSALHSGYMVYPSLFYHARSTLVYDNLNSIPTCILWYIPWSNDPPLLGHASHEFHYSSHNTIVIDIHDEMKSLCFSVSAVHNYRAGQIVTDRL